MLKILFLLGFVYAPSFAFAQTATRLVDPVHTTGWIDAFFRGFGAGQFSLINLVYLIFGVFVTLGVEWVYLRMRRYINMLNPVGASKSLGRMDFDHVRGHKLLVLGEGGAGKSSLLQALSHGSAGRSDKLTDQADFATFAMALGVSNSQPRGSGLVISTVDYNGQRPGSVPGLMKQLTAGNKQHVTAVILVVDVVDAPTSADDPVRTQVAEVDTKRIRKHIRAWDGNALEFVKGDLKGGTPKDFILLINAVDAIEKYSYILGEPLTDVHRNEILAYFEEFRETLSKTWRDSKVQTVVGSVYSTHTIAELRIALTAQAPSGGAG